MKKSKKIDEIITAKKGTSEQAGQQSKIIKDFLIASVGKSLLGIQIEYLREVIDIKDAADIIPIPFTPPYLSGIINVRGEILPVLSLPALLGMGKQPVPVKLIVVDYRQKVSFPVERISDLIQIDIARIRPLHESAAPESQRFLSGEFSYDGASVFIIDVLKMFESEYFQ
jgi:purine-binding chemotaxis protein CheW